MSELDELARPVADQIMRAAVALMNWTASDAGDNTAAAREIWNEAFSEFCRPADDNSSLVRGGAGLLRTLVDYRRANP